MESSREGSSKVFKVDEEEVFAGGIRSVHGCWIEPQYRGGKYPAEK
jgi:hypothetical protein